MANALDKVLITIVLVSFLIFIAYYGYDLFECQIAKLRYERVITTLKVLFARVPTRLSFRITGVSLLLSCRHITHSSYNVGSLTYHLV
jgi:hypothetical protein